MSKGCIICQIASGEIPSKKVYEDDSVMAVLDVNGSNPGHCFVFPKQHYTIIEQIPDMEVAKCFNAANKVSTAIFEGLKVQGTNLFVTNGIAGGQTVAHFTINVVPRKENDGINLQWNPKQLSEEEMSTVELKLREAANKIAVSGNQESKSVVSQQQSNFIVLDEEEEDIFSRQMNRLP